MIVPPIDLLYLRDRLRELAGRIREVWEASNHDPDDVDSPSLLGDAMVQLIDMLGHVDAATLPAQPGTSEINALAEYGLHLLDELSRMAADLEQAPLAREVEALALPFALWIARHGGEIRHLRPVVNALAQLANQASQPQTMTELYTLCCELVEATSPACEEPAMHDPGHPWRLLLFNRAIVATRSHNPELMEPAFDAIVECLPSDAQRFFAEGMEQMAIINYPEHVQDIVRRYFLAHAVPRRLH